ncbi:hypothetical protein E4H12_05430 [Candidatus Thorarchaeota archaeon]|nr:MAG: hypothetical protein E4H12_05430 [Candidatus Thorarchaeota archaeon]
MAKAKNYVGRSLKIKAGTKVSRLGRTATRDIDTVVRIRDQETTRAGKTRVFWKSNGYKASTLI